MSTVTVVPTVEPSTGPTDPPRVRLNVTDTGTPAVNATTVTRSDPDGTTVPVRTFDGNPLTLTTSGSTRVGLLYDYEPWYGAPVTYSTLESPTVTSSVTVDEDQLWLIHPGEPALSRPVTVAELTGRGRAVNRGLTQRAGGRYPIPQSDGQRKAPTYTLTLRTTTAADRIAMDALLDDSSVLLLNIPVGKQWGITHEYLSIGDSTEDRLYPYGPEQRRTWPLPVTVVDMPVGGQEPERTYADLLIFDSYNAMKAFYADYPALLAGP